MASPFHTPNIAVPGLLSDDALQEQLKQFSDRKNALENATPPPSSAVEASRRIQSEYLDQPLRALSRAAPYAMPAPMGQLTSALAGGVSSLAMEAPQRDEQRVAQDRAMELRSRYLSEGGGSAIGAVLMGPLASVFSEASPLSRMGALTPEESQQTAEARARDVREREAAVRAHAETREDLRGLTADQARTMGIPVAPGTGDPNLDGQLAEESERQSQLDAQRVERAEEATQESDETLDDPSLQPQQTWWLNAARSAVKSMGRVSTGAMKSLPIMWEQTVGDGNRSDVRAWMDTVDVTMEKLLPGDKARSKDFINELSQGAGSMAGYMILGTVGTGIGLPAGVATTALGAATGATEQYEDAERFNASGTQKLLSFLAGGALGSTEAIPINRMLMRAETATGGLVSRMLQRTTAGSMEEFLQELGQSVGQDTVAQWTYDENRDIDIANAARQGLIGGIVGGMAASATSTLVESGVVGAQPAEGQDPQQPAAPQPTGAERETLVGAEIAEKDEQFEELTRRAEEGTDTSLLPITVAPGEAAEVDTETAETAETAEPADTLAMRVGQAEDTAVREIVDEADVALPERAQEAVSDFVGVRPGETSGIMRAEALERAVRGDDPDLAQEIETTFAPVRERLRERLGDRVVLYRVQEPIAPRDPDVARAGFDTETRSVLSWTSDPAFAEGYAGVRENRPALTEDQITEAERIHAAEGEVSIPGTNYRLVGTNEFTGSDGQPATTVDIYDGNEFVTDTDSVRAFMEEVNEGREEANQRNETRRERIVEAAVSLDDVVWVTDRLGQSEFMVRNTPETGVYINERGEVKRSDDAFLAQTSRTRGPLPGEQSRVQRGLPGAPDESAADVSLRKIAQNVIRLLDLTVRQGRFTLKGDAIGQYSQRQNTVRLKTWNDLSTLVHEGGHALEMAAESGRLRDFVNANQARLTDVARRLYGGDVNSLSAKARVSEGFAEFFRVYTLNRKFAENEFAGLTQDFNDLLDTQAPDLREGLDIVGEQFAAWLQLPSAQLVSNMVVSGREDTAINEALADIREGGFGTWFSEIVTRKIVQPVINRNASLNLLVSRILNVSADRGDVVDLKRAEDPRTLIRMASNTGSRASVQTVDGVMGYRSVTPGSRGLREALLRYHGRGPDEQLSAIDSERQRDFAAYTIALRGIDEYRRLAEGKIERPPLAASLGDLRQTVQEMNDKYGNDFVEAAQIVNEYGVALWQKAFDAGLMSKETYQSGLDRQFYVPLARDMSDRSVATGDMRATEGQSIVRRFRGSDRDVIDPMDSLMQKTYSLERVIAENDVKKALASLADRVGQAGALVERVPAQRILGQQFSVQEVARQLTKDPNLSQADAQDLMETLEASIEEGNRIALFRSEQAVARGENVMFFWEDGNLSAIQLQDGDIGADVINIMNGTGRETLPVMTDLLAYTSSAFRASITSWPDFLLVNFIRDQVSAWILTDVGYTPFATGLRGVGDELRQGEWARQYNAAMGVMGGMNTAALHTARVDRDINALRKKGYVARVFSEPGLTGSIRGMARITELTETGTRLGIYRSAFDRAKKDGLTDYEAAVEAGYTATDYIDFGLNGNQMLMLRRTIPFLNAQLQGFYKMMRTLGGDEVRQRRGLRFALGAFFKDTNNLPLSRTERDAVRTGRKAWLKMLSLGFVGAAITMAFRDDPDYQDASEYLRTTGWVIPMGDGEVAYIPKPFELAVVSNFVERGIEHASGDDEARRRFLRGMAMNLSPPTSPPLIQVAVEQTANRDFFRGREIVPDYMRALAPELQYNHYTSELAKSLGSITGWSPMRIDHVMSGLGASAYRDITTMYNMTDPDRPASDKTDWPVTRRFVRDARRGSTTAQDFWKFASTMDGTLRRGELTYRRYLEQGRDAAADEYLSTLDEDTRAYAVLNAHFEADAKRLNPFYRARQLATIVSGVRREMTSPLGVESTETDFSEAILMSASEKAAVDKALSEYIRREMRNTLIYMDAPGWAGKKPLRTDTTLDLLDATDPRLASELRRRIANARVYDADVVRDYWPDVRNRLIRDREDAFLDDVLSLAEVIR